MAQGWRPAVSSHLTTPVQAYLFRWKIERLYFLCKVGFKLEDWHQETAERIARRPALV